MNLLGSIHQLNSCKCQSSSKARHVVISQYVGKCPLHYSRNKSVIQVEATSKRDFITIFSLLLATISQKPAYAGIEKYIKKKKLDPLYTYVPIVLEAREELESFLSKGTPDAAEARRALRSGPFSGFRDNVRAIGEYAATSGQNKDAQGLVSAFFKALDSYDLALFQSITSGNEINQTDVSAKLTATLKALDDLLATVPTEVMDQSLVIFLKIKAKTAEAPSGTEDLEEKVYEKLL